MKKDFISFEKVKKRFSEMNKAWQDSFCVQKKIPAPVIRKQMKYAVAQGGFFQVMQTLTTGPFLTAYALVLGANNLIIGLLAAVPFLSHVMQTPVTFLIEKYRKRKKLSMIFGLAGLPLLPVMAALVFFNPSEILAHVLFWCVVLRFLCSSSVVCVWNSWMREFVPWRLHSRYYVSRLKQMTTAVIICNLTGALIVDAGGFFFPGKEILAYPVLYLLAALAGAISLYCTMKVSDKDTPPKEDDTDTEPLSAEIRREIQDKWHDLKRFAMKIKEPFKNLNFRRLMVFFCLFNFGVNLIAPFFTVVLLNVLQFPLISVVALIVLSQTAGFCVMSLWETIARKFSYKNVLQISALLYMLAVFLWLFVRMPDKYFLTVPLLILIYLTLGIATAGVNVSTYNLALTLAPNKSRMGTYIAAESTLNALCAGGAPIIGGVWADFFKNIELSVIVQWKTSLESLSFQTISVSHWDFFFLFSILFAAFSLLFLSRVEVVRDMAKREIAAAFFKQTKETLFTATPFIALRKLAEHFSFETKIKAGYRGVTGVFEKFKRKEKEKG